MKKRAVTKIYLSIPGTSKNYVVFYRGRKEKGYYVSPNSPTFDWISDLINDKKLSVWAKLQIYPTFILDVVKE